MAHNSQNLTAPVQPTLRKDSSAGSQQDGFLESLQPQAQAQTGNRRLSHVQTIGPTQLVQQLDKIQKEMTPFDLWRNIPMPVYQASTGAYQSLDLLKRFVIFLDSKFERLITSYTTSNNDMQNYIDSFKLEVKQEQKTFEVAMSNKLSQQEKRIVDELERKQDWMQKELTLNFQRRATEDAASLRLWANRAIDDKIRASEKTASAKLKKATSQIYDSFNVPGVIGPMHCRFLTYRDCMEAQTKLLDNLKEKQNELQGNLFKLTCKQQENFQTLQLMVHEQQETKKDIIHRSDTSKNDISKRLQALKDAVLLQLNEKSEKLNQEIKQGQKQQKEEVYKLQQFDFEIAKESQQIKEHVAGVYQSLESKVNRDELDKKMTKKMIQRKSTRLTSQQSTDKVQQLMSTGLSQQVKQPIDPQVEKMAQIGAKQMLKGGLMDRFIKSKTEGGTAAEQPDGLETTNMGNRTSELILENQESQSLSSQHVSQKNLQSVPEATKLSTDGQSAQDDEEPDITAADSSQDHDLTDMENRIQKLEKHIVCLDTAYYRVLKNKNLLKLDQQCHKIVNGKKVSLAESLASTHPIGKKRGRSDTKHKTSDKFNWTQSQLDSTTMLKDQQNYLQEYQWPVPHSGGQGSDSLLWAQARSIRQIPTQQTSTDARQIETPQPRRDSPEYCEFQTKQVMQARDDLLKKKRATFRGRPQTSVGRYKRDSSVGLDTGPDPKSYQELFLKKNRGASQAILNVSNPPKIQSSAPISTKQQNYRTQPKLSEISMSQAGDVCLE